MNRDVAKIWVKALRSGEYKQGRGCLRDNKNQFCCLGLLCDLHGNLNLLENNIWEAQFEIMAYNKHEVYPPEPVLKWAGITNDTTVKLSNLNDIGTSFSQIADYIEKNVEAL